MLTTMLLHSETPAKWKHNTVHSVALNLA